MTPSLSQQIKLTLESIMQSAKNSLDNSEQTAYQFAQLTPDEIARYHGQLACPGCNGHAYFRGPSRNGRAPCFFGFHEDGCQFAAIQSAAARANRQREQNPWQRIVVDLSYGSHPTNESFTPRKFDSHPPERWNSAGHDNWSGSDRRQRPSSLLQDLINNPQFSQSRQPLTVEGLDTNAADFFVNLDRLSPNHINQYHGYWGQIANAAMGSTDEIWLNSAGQGYPSVCIPRHLVNELYSRHQINRGDYSMFAGAYMLVVGFLETSWAGKLYIEITDMGKIALCLPTMR